jgi:hypothetical protein
MLTINRIIEGIENECKNEYESIVLSLKDEALQNKYPAFEDVRPILYQKKEFITLLNKLSTPRALELVGTHQENLKKIVKALSILSRYKNKDIRAFRNIKLFYDSFEQKEALHHVSKIVSNIFLEEFTRLKENPRTKNLQAFLNEYELCINFGIPEIFDVSDKLEEVVSYSCDQLYPNQKALLEKIRLHKRLHKDWYEFPDVVLNMFDEVPNAIPRHHFQLKTVREVIHAYYQRARGYRESGINKQKILRVYEDIDALIKKYPQFRLNREHLDNEILALG